MLYLVPTPIGNLKDITLRSIEVLESCDYILAEDTRVTKKLLHHLGIDKAVRSNHAHNESRNLSTVLADLREEKNVALVSDAGTPGISDPGFLIVRACRTEGIPVTALPGATAFVPVLVASGLPSDRFFYEGFLPNKKGRKKRLEFLKGVGGTIVFYESPYRLLKLLGELSEIFGSHSKICVAREMTKMYEEVRTEFVDEAIEYWSKEGTIKGEFVVVLDAGKS